MHDAVCLAPLAHSPLADFYHTCGVCGRCMFGYMFSICCSVPASFLFLFVHTVFLACNSLSPLRSLLATSYWCMQAAVLHIPRSYVFYIPPRLFSFDPSLPLLQSPFSTSYPPSPHHLLMDWCYHLLAWSLRVACLGACTVPYCFSYAWRFYSLSFITEDINRKGEQLMY